MRATVVLVTLVASALVAGKAVAGDDLRLSWQAPAGCPQASQVRDAALRAVARERRDGEPLEADARVEHGERWTVVIRTRRAGVAAAERRLDATSCGALADATAVILALALIPEAPAPLATTPPEAQLTAPLPAATTPPAGEATAPSPATTRVAEPPPLAAVAPVAPRAGGAEHRPSDRVSTHSIGVSASVATDATTLPAPAVGGRAALAWTPGPARVELGGGYFSDQSKTTGTSPAGASFTLLVAGGRGCWAVARGAIELSPCIGAEVAIVNARGFGAASNYEASAAWVSGAGGALLRVPVAPWLALRADADALVPLARPRFVVEGDGAVHQPGSLGVRGAIGAELLFL